MVCGCILVFFFAALDQTSFTWENVREPSKNRHVDGVLSHSIFPHLHALSPQSISLMACGTWSSLCLVSTKHCTTGNKGLEWWARLT